MMPCRIQKHFYYKDFFFNKAVGDRGSTPSFDAELRDVYYVRRECWILDKMYPFAGIKIDACLD
jgi:hypothetical protein